MNSAVPHPVEAERRSDREIETELERLRNEVAALRERVHPADGSDGGAADTSSRRQLFRLAGASAAGAVAGTMLRSGPVAAADPNDVVKNLSNPVVDTTTLDGSFAGPTLSLFNRGTAATSASVYASSSGSTSPTVRADNDASNGLGGIAVGGNAPGGRDLVALGSGRIAMTDHDFGTSEAYAAGEIHQSGGTLFAMVTPSVRRVIASPAAAGAMHPIDPVRVYDSRAGAPLPGRLGPGEVRVVSVADARDIVTGAIMNADAVPPGATAVMFNLTVDGTAGPGWLSVERAGAVSATASTINWTADGTTIANGSMVVLGGDRQVQVRCAPGASTDFILDVVGYYA